MRQPALRKPRPARIGDNGGPPLEEKKRKSETGKGEIGRIFDWRFAHRKAWKKPREIALRRQERAAIVADTGRTRLAQGRLSHCVISYEIQNVIS